MVCKARHKKTSRDYRNIITHPSCMTAVIIIIVYPSRKSGKKSIQKNWKNECNTPIEEIHD